MLHPGMTDEDMLASGVASVLTRPRAAAQCRELGCLYKQGEFVCEFHSAKTNKKKDATSDSAIRTEVISGKRNLTPHRWMQLCPGDRECEWRINYTYNATKAVYTVTPKCLVHAGHLVDAPTTATTRFLSASDVTEDMWSIFCRWVAIPLGGHKLRKVSPYLVHFWCLRSGIYDLLSVTLQYIYSPQMVYLESISSA